MSRLTLIHTQQELVAAVAEKTGRHVLLNAVFDSETPEAIRLNLAAPNCSYYSSSHGAQTFTLDEIPFRVLSPAVLEPIRKPVFLKGWIYWTLAATRTQGGGDGGRCVQGRTQAVSE